MAEFIEVNGITSKLAEDGCIKTTIHVDDLVTALSSLTKRPNGTVVLVARKRFSESSMGHTHYKPFYKTATKCDTAPTED